MLKKTVCVALIFMTVLLTGCWNNHEIIDFAIVSGEGIDKAPDGNIELTDQLINTTKSGSMTSGSSQSSGSTVTISSEGVTMFDATRNMIPKLSQKPFYSHVQLMVIGEDAAKEGLGKIWDLWDREQESSEKIKVIVVKNGTAKSVLEAKSDLEEIGAVAVANSLENKEYGKNILMPAYKVSELLSHSLTGIVTGVINPGRATALKDMKVEGGAVFKHGKLAGYLDNEQTRGYLFAADQVQNLILTIDNPKEKGKLVSIEVENSSSKLTAELVGGRPKFDIEITAAGNIGDEQGSADLTDAESLKTLESETAALITDNIISMAEKSQKVFDCDILNFSDFLYKHQYSDFKKIKSNWNELYKNAETSIKVEFSIENSGVILKPAYSK